MPENTIDARCSHRGCKDKRHYVMNGECHNCAWTGYVLITNGHEARDVEGRAKCPRCECVTVRAREFVEGNSHVA